MPRRSPPLESYDPRLIAIWQQSALKAVRVPVDNRPVGVRLRARLYSCRKALQAAGHEAYQLAQYGSVSLLEEKPNVWVVIVQAADTNLSAALDKAQIKIEEAPEIDFSAMEEIEEQ